MMGSVKMETVIRHVFGHLTQTDGSAMPEPQRTPRGMKVEFYRALIQLREGEATLQALNRMFEGVVDAGGVVNKYPRYRTFMDIRSEGIWLFIRKMGR